MNEWHRIDTVTELQSPWLDAGFDLLEAPSGDRSRFYWSAPGDGVSVVARTETGDVVMVEEYRPRRQSIEYKLPTGGVEDSESFAAAGRRELEEETGYKAEDVTTIQTYTPSAFERRTRGVVVATNLTQSTPDREPDEQINVVHTSPTEAFAHARETGDAWTLLPLVLAQTDGYL